MRWVREGFYKRKRKSVEFSSHFYYYLCKCTKHVNTFRCLLKSCNCFLTMGKHNNVTCRNKQKNFTYLSAYIYYLNLLPWLLGSPGIWRQMCRSCYFQYPSSRLGHPCRVNWTEHTGAARVELNIPQELARWGDII